MYLSLFRRCSSTLLRDSYDVVISGGGMVGKTLACALSQQSPELHVLVVERNEGKTMPKDKKIPYSSACIAVNRSTINLLEDINVWNSIKELRAQPVKYMKIADACSDAKTALGYVDKQQPTAYIVQNDVLNGCLQRQLRSLDNVHLRQGCVVQSIIRSGDDSLDPLGIYLEEGVTTTFLKSNLLVVAEGTHSELRDKLQFSTKVFDYKVDAFVSTMRRVRGDPFVAYQRFLPSGPVAALPLSDTHYAAIWFADKTLSQRLDRMSPIEFEAAINEAMVDPCQRSILSTIVDSGINKLCDLLQPKAPTLVDSCTDFEMPLLTYDSECTGGKFKFPICMKLANQYVQRRIALVGDSAHRMHPLAGQGANVGFADVVEMKRTVKSALDVGGDIGSLMYLLRYEQARQPQAIGKALLMHAFHYSFGTSLAPAVWARSLGFTAFDRIKPVKDAALWLANNG